MIKNWILLCLCFAWCNSDGNRRVKCHDCTPIWQCEDAIPYMDMANNNLRLITQNFCGITDTFNVCCSKFEEKHPNLNLLPESCGHIQDSITQYRIINGMFASLYEFPWMVLIFYRTGSGINHQCSGTLINSRYVLTAAHCVVNLNIEYVRVGEYETENPEDCDEGVCESQLQDIRVEEEISHEQYKSFPNYVNDIALLRMEQNVNMSFKNTGTICLPTTKRLKTKSITKEYATVAGWGRTEYGRGSYKLLKVNVPIQSSEECHQHYRYVSHSEPRQFCAGIHNRDSCQGDSGGPLMIKDKEASKFVQYGIVSSGSIDCGSYRPGLYTDIRKYMDWILDNIKK